jgi:2-C-methyl-D-erythritol 4-phosphate cytidylyltransferase
MPRTAAILLAAGSSRRMQGAVADKVLAPLGGRPVFTYAAAAFMESGVADFYAVVYRDQRQMLALAAYAPTPAVFVRGGRERQDSVRLALAALPPDIATVFIHDCARPLVRPEQLRALHRIARRGHAVILAHRVTDTIKERKARLRTLDRSLLWAMETPQVFPRRLIARAYAHALARGRRVTDDAAAVELLGRASRTPVLLENLLPNPKLTTPADLAYVEFLLRPSPGG